VQLAPRAKHVDLDLVLHGLLDRVGHVVRALAEPRAELEHLLRGLLLLRREPGQFPRHPIMDVRKHGIVLTRLEVHRDVIEHEEAILDALH
jgi:hypothetical protein